VLQFGRVRVEVFVDGTRLESLAEEKEVPGDHRVHGDDQHEGHYERSHRVDKIDHLHELEVDGPHFALLPVGADVDQTRDPEEVDLRDHRHNGQTDDDGLRPGHGAYVRPLQRVLHGDEALDGEGDDQPHAQRGAHRTDVHEELTPTVRVEYLEDVVEAAVHHQHHEQEAEVGHGQRGQVVTGTAHLQVRAQEDHAGEEVAEEADGDDCGNVIGMEDSQVRGEEVAVYVRVVTAGVELGRVEQFLGEVRGDVVQATHCGRGSTSRRALRVSSSWCGSVANKHASVPATGVKRV
jgi:hypothetical protein